MSSTCDRGRSRSPGSATSCSSRGRRATASPTPTSTRGALRSRRPDLTTPGLLGLPLAWLAVFFVVPIAIVAAYSFDALSLYPGAHPLTLRAWHDFLHGGVYLRLFWKSVKISLLVSTIIVVLA